MHDIDQIAMEDSGRSGVTRTEDYLEFAGEHGEDEDEFEHEFEDEYESGAEYEDETGAGYEHRTGDEYEDEHAGPHESTELELATELLEVSGEHELDRFLGDLVRSASGAVHDFARTREGRQIGGILKQAAGRVLPVVGRAAGRAAGGALAGVTGGSRRRYRQTGAQVGGALGTLARRCFGLELEGMSGEDKELEIARRFVHFARDAVRRCLAGRGTGPAAQVARRAATQAGRRWAPGLVTERVLDAAPLPRRFASQATGTATRATGSAGSPCPRCSGSSEPVGRSGSGRWERRGNTIVLFTS